jgi:tRNA G37 N-methylase TrmD
MVMKPEPIFKAVEGVLGDPPCCPVILMSPQGRLFNHRLAEELTISAQGFWSRRRIAASGPAVRAL